MQHSTTTVLMLSFHTSRHLSSSPNAALNTTSLLLLFHLSSRLLPPPSSLSTYSYSLSSSSAPSMSSSSHYFTSAAVFRCHHVLCTFHECSYASDDDDDNVKSFHSYIVWDESCAHVYHLVLSWTCITKNSIWVTKQFLLYTSPRVNDNYEVFPVQRCCV